MGTRERYSIRFPLASRTEKDGTKPIMTIQRSNREREDDELDYQSWRGMPRAAIAKAEGK